MAGPMLPTPVGGPFNGGSAFGGAHDPAVENFVRWLQLRQIAGQALDTFSPTSKAGLLNDAAMFAGGPKGEDVLGQWHPAGKFESYSIPKAQASGHLIFREGNKLIDSVNYPKGGMNDLSQRAYAPKAVGDLVARAQGHNPFIRASQGAVDDQLNQMSRLDTLRQRAAQSMVSRRQLDEQLGSAPMQAHQAYPEHDAALVHGPSVINHPNFIRALLQRRYEAQAGHNHN